MEWAAHWRFWEVCSVYGPGASGACPVSLPGAGFRREVSSAQGWSKEEQLKMDSSQQRGGAEAVWWLEQTDLSCGALGSFPLPYFPLLSPPPSEKWFCHGQAKRKFNPIAFYVNIFKSCGILRKSRKKESVLVWLCNPLDDSHQAPVSMGFPRQEY